MKRFMADIEDDFDLMQKIFEEFDLRSRSLPVPERWEGAWGSSDAIAYSGNDPWCWRVDLDGDFGWFLMVRNAIGTFGRSLERVEASPNAVVDEIERLLIREVRYE
jgi:hypothetical protein